MKNISLLIKILSIIFYSALQFIEKIKNATGKTINYNLFLHDKTSSFEGNNWGFLNANTSEERFLIYLSYLKSKGIELSLFNTI
jgi:hypothetical protein